MDQFSRLKKLINDSEWQKIKDLHVLIVGIGGVGGYTVEALTRMGVGYLTIVDSDVVDITNLNRQIISLHSNLNDDKVLVAKKRCLDINPNIQVKAIKQFVNKDNIQEIFNDNYDYIIDACDTITTKLLLIKEADKRKIKIISIMGTGNKFDPTKLEIIDIYKTNYDPLAKVMRKLCKDNGIKKLKVVASFEKPIKLVNDSTPGSTSLVPSVAGIYAASYIINDALADKKSCQIY